LGQVVQQLEAQSATTKKGFDETIALFRTDVIPAMAEENQTNRKIIISQLTQANKDTQKNLETFSAKNQQLNQKLIKILQESLKQELENKPLLDAIKKDMGVIQEILVGTNQDIAGNHSVIAEVKKAMVITSKNLIVADEKTNKLAESLQALQVKNKVSNEALGALKAGLDQAGEFNKLADEKFNKLIDLSSKLAVHSTELESSVTGQLKDSAQKEDNRTTKVDLANEKLSRLIEILKAVVREQAKLDPVAKALSDIQKKQKALQKAQAGFIKDQAAVKEALADLRRKANVNISRSEDIKKTLGKLGLSKQ
jgi:chromosome segregation ATPase